MKKVLNLLLVLFGLSLCSYQNQNVDLHHFKLTGIHYSEVHHKNTQPDTEEVYIFTSKEAVQSYITDSPLNENETFITDVLNINYSKYDLLLSPVYSIANITDTFEYDSFKFIAGALEVFYNYQVASISLPAEKFYIDSFIVAKDIKITNFTYKYNKQSDQIISVETKDIRYIS